jgi:hypothetical protein
MNVQPANDKSTSDEILKIHEMRDFEHFLAQTYMLLIKITK